MAEQKNKFPKYTLKLLSNLLIILGLVCFSIAIYLIWQRNNPNRLAFTSYVNHYQSLPAKNPPVRVRIRDVHIDLPLFPAQVKNGLWDTTTQGASYLVTSSVPAQTGNSIIYAHNWASLFGPLLSIKRGMNVEIEYQNKLKKTFIVRGTAVVSKDQSSVLQPTNDKRLTLYTCTGFFDEQRMVAVAIYRED